MTITPASVATRPGRWISIVLVVLGTIGIIYGIGSGVVRGFTSHASTADSWTASSEGVEQVRLSTTAVAFEVRFDEIDHARLEAENDSGPVQRWRLERAGAALVVDTGDRWYWWGGWPYTFGGRGEERVVLTLPADLERSGLDLVAEVAAGSFATEGDWGAATIDLSAGSVDLAGTAESLAVTVSAGDARIDIATEGTATFDVSAGRVVGALTGEQPAAIDARVSAGSVELTIPDGAYAVTEDVSAGDSEVRVVDDPSAASTIDVEVSAGNVTLRPGR